MKTATIILRGAAWIIIAMLIIPPVLPAQDPVQPEQSDRFKKEELAQMLAPIALYPDSLIAQMLMASTYPLEIVEAERWLRQNKKLKGDELDAALQEKTWDPSVKALCHFPDLLFSMSEKLDQTRKLGDAFLSQQDDVMVTIQELRRKAEEQGNLRTTKELNVIDDRDEIRLEPADPQVVYVPVYNPLYVYGPWWYPAYPPYYWYYPAGIVISGGFIGFSAGFFVGIDFFSWSWFDWPRHFIHIDIHKTRRFHRPDIRRPGFDRPVWSHNPIHRRGVAYRDRNTSERFGLRPPRIPVVGPERRGYPAGGVERRVLQPSQGPVERRERGITPPVRIEPRRLRETPFRGIGDGNFERKASERGGISRQGESIRQIDRGASRQGGGIPQIDRGTGRQGGDTGRKSGNEGGGFRDTGKGRGTRR
ncbi:MAG: DUF3300 domain-containing protein [Nitrospirae bacterium]|nr:DUF3300 domain-containing protein [Nitrospirota bacterium]